MEKKPVVSVVITAHNAGETIAPCLKSIAGNKGFAPGEIEIILVDDRSRDDTAETARSLGLADLVIVPNKRSATAANRARQTRFVDEKSSQKNNNFKKSSKEKYEDRGLTGRQEALDSGFRKARGEIIMVCDADAVVPPGWIRDMTAPLHSAAGTAGMIEFRGKKRWLAKLQSIDSLCYFFLSSMFNRLGLTGGIFFGNFAFKKEVYEKTGGFEKLGFALTEDLQFFRAMRRSGYPVFFSRSAPVCVQAASGWRDLIKRTRRVSSGGFSLLSSALGLWLVSFIVLSIMALWQSPVILALLGIRYLAGAGFAASAAARARRPSLLPLALVYEFFVIGLGLITFFAIRFNKKVEWGGITYDR